MAWLLYIFEFLFRSIIVAEQHHPPIHERGNAMKPTYGLPILLKTLLALAVVVSFNGCADKPVPPLFNLYGYQRLVVIPFDNNTQDPALAGALQDEMTSEIVNLNAVPVIDAGQVAAYLGSIQAKASDVSTDPGLRQKISQ